MQKGFIEINKRNLELLPKEINDKTGKVLIYGTKTNWMTSDNTKYIDDAEFYLYGYGSINKKGNEINTTSNCGSNRDYSLREYHKNEIKECFFDALKVGDYEFQIHGMCTVARSLFCGDNILYIPKKSSVEDALKFSVTEMVNKINRYVGKKKTGLGEKEIEKIIKYCMRDLKTGKVLENNIKGGQNADAAVGFVENGRNIIAKPNR